MATNKEKIEGLELTKSGGCYVTGKCRIAFSSESGKPNGWRLLNDHHGNKEGTGKLIRGGTFIHDDAKDSSGYSFADVVKHAVIKVAKAGLDKSDMEAFYDFETKKFLNNKQKCPAYLDGNKNRPKGEDKPYIGFEGKTYSKGIRTTENAGPIKVYNVGANSNTPALEQWEEGLKLPADGAYVNVRLYIYANKEWGTVSSSPDIVCYRADEFEEFVGYSLSEEETNELFDGVDDGGESIMEANTNDEAVIDNEDGDEENDFNFG
jgi:hypothetical protein